MSEILLESELDKHYSEQIKDLFGESKDSIAYLNAVTKSYIKDGNTSHAISFFKSELENRKQNKANQDELLIKLYDSLHGDTTGVV